MKAEFFGQLWALRRDSEDETKLTLCMDASQLDRVITIPAQALLKVTIETEEA
jgi:hypothetical protein